MAIHTDVDKFIYALNLFNEKVEKLLNLSFVQQFIQEGNVAGMKATRRDDNSFFVQDTSRGPSSESIDAFVLTIRFFIQNNEECSLMNLAKHYQGATVGIESATLFLENRKGFNADLDELTGIAMDEHKNIIMSDSEDGLTRDEVFDICVYGGLSHANRSKKEKYDAFNNTPFPLISGIFRQCFVDTLFMYCNYLYIQMHVNKDMLVELKKPVTAGESTES